MILQYVEIRKSKKSSLAGFSQASVTFALDHVELNVNTW